MARRYYSSTAARTTLASGVDDTTTTLSVVAVSGWPASYPYTLVIDQDTVNEELVSVTNRSGTTLTVTRGIDGTSAVAHDAGAAVNHGVSAQDFDEPNAFINGTGVVTSTMIEDGTIVDADVNASAAIAQSKIADLTSDLAAKLDLAGGKILQIVRATDTTDRSTTSTGFADVTGMSVTITPQKSDSAVLIIAAVAVQVDANGTGISLRITDSSDNAISGAEQPISIINGDQFNLFMTVIAYATPATTSATTYKLRFRRNAGAGTCTIRNAGLNTGQIYAIEVSA